MDLERFLSRTAPLNLTGQESTTAFEPLSGMESGEIRTSTVTDLPKLEKEETDRLANSVIAVLNSESSKKGSGAYFDRIFNPRTAGYFPQKRSTRKITAGVIKELRSRAGASILEYREAISRGKGNMNDAEEKLAELQAKAENSREDRGIRRKSIYRSKQ